MQEITLASKAASQTDIHPDVSTALRDCRQAFWSVAVFSGAVNLLMLAGPIYMLQVYDRVLASRSVPTLLALSALLIAAYAFQGAFDYIRSRIVVRAAALLDRHLVASVHAAVLRISVQSRRGGVAQQPLRDLDQIRSFLTGTGPIAIVDLPWMPAYLVICFLVHPILGLMSLLGGALLFSLTILTERSSREPSRELAVGSAVRSSMIDADSRNSETAAAMGMGRILGERWAKSNSSYVSAIGRSSDVVNAYGSLSKMVRMLLQSAMLAVGAYLVIRRELTGGAMIAASIMMGRALAPIETAIANWRGFVSARQSIRRLSHVLTHIMPRVETLDLPRPRSSIELSNVWVAAPATDSLTLRGINFQLAAGEVLGIIGPSGAGKTSLIRTLVGIWRPARGTIRIDGATLDQWNPAVLGPAVGFVAQPVELFDGTVAENIARMNPQFEARDVLKAAQAAGAHEMILRLQNGYNTQIGDAGLALSAGQRQRIALARALYGEPFLVVLDEPHANLDSDGENALTEAILSAKKRGAIVILIAHRPSELVTCDKVLILSNGTQYAFGNRDEVLDKVSAPRRPDIARVRRPRIRASAESRSAR